jgi:hypothetical protein
MPRRGEISFLPFAVGVGALVVLAPARASAEERERLLDLEWSSPEGCPDHDEVVARVDDLVGHARPMGHRRVSARGRMTTSAATTRERRYRLELVVVGNEANRRSMTGDDCSHLVDAAALILALDIDPDVLTRREAEAAPPADRDHVTTSPPAAAPPPVDKTLPGPLRRPAHTLAPVRRALHLLGGARLVLDEGSLPRTTLGVGALVALARGPLMFEVQGTAYNEQFTVAGPRGGRGGAYVSLATLGAHACWRGRALDVDWRACLGGEAGLESTTGVSVARPETATGLWSAASLMFAARVLPRSVVSPTAGLALVHPIGAPPVFIGGFGTIFEPPVVVVRCFFGLDARFF